MLSRKERACYQLANELKEMIEDGNPLAGEASVYSDLLNASISEVNWKEIANSFLEERNLIPHSGSCLLWSAVLFNNEIANLFGDLQSMGT